MAKNGVQVTIGQLTGAITKLSNSFTNLGTKIQPQIQPLKDFTQALKDFVDADFVASATS